MKITKLLLITVALATAISSAAKSQTLTATLVEVAPGTSVYGTVDGGYYQDWATGVLAFDKCNGFCSEPSEPLAYGDTVIYEIQDPATLANAGIIARLIGGYLSSDMSSSQASAVQWAIWEVVGEKTSGAYSLYDGNVMISTDTSIADLADQYLLNVNTYEPADMIYYTNDTYQNVVSWQVPEPASMALAGLSALLLIRRRR